MLNPYISWLTSICEPFSKGGIIILTRAKICYNLKESPYTAKFLVSGKTLTFYFTSKNHLEKFKTNYKDYQNYINISLQKRFKCNFKFDLLGLIIFYNNVETRGFLMCYDGVWYTWLNEVLLSGGKLTNKNYQELCNDLTLN